MFASTLRAALALATLLPFAVAAQTIAYTSPDGRFSLQVPTGWKIVPDPSISSVTFRNGAVSVAVMVSQQHPSNAMTAQRFIDGNQSELKGQCPTFRNRQSGPSTLLGYPALTTIATCSDPRSPAVAEDLATLTPDYLLIGFTVISPLARYYDTLPLIDAMRSSLRLAHHTAPVKARPAPIDSPAMTDLGKACLVGAFTQEDCARRQGAVLTAEAGPTDTTPHIPGSLPYRDPQHRFIADIPPGWTAKPEGDNGSLGVQLRNGSDWINIMPSKAPTAKEAVLAHERDMIAGSHLDRQPPLGPAGLIQIFGHGTELTYDSITGSDPDGSSVQGLVAGVASTSGGGPVILLGSSITQKPSASSNAPDIALGVAMSLNVSIAKP